MKFSKLTQDAEIRSFSFDPEIGRIESNSELVLPSSLFVCISGLKHDSHNFIDEALSRGASAVVIDESRGELIKSLEEKGVPFAVYPNTRRAEAVLTSRFCGDPHKKLKIFGVTGTNGKTSTVSFLNCIFTRAGYNCRTIGTLTGKLTTPDPCELYPLLSEYAESGVEYLFMEVSSHALYLEKTAPIEFECGIFTNLTPEHLDFHETMESYAEAKSRLFKASKRSVINLDSDYSEIIAKSAGRKVFFCSQSSENADFSAKNIVENGIYGIRYDLEAKDLIFKIRSMIPGRFTVMNTLEAAAAAITEGISPEVIRGAVGGFQGVRGRLERIRIPTNDFSVYIDFAHTPDALENILKTVKGFISAEQRLVLVFGCGGDRDKTKRPLMGETAATLSDFVIVTSDNSRSEEPENIISDIVKGISHGCPYTVIENRKEAIEYAVENARRGDVILLAGKGHEEYEITKFGKKPFSERELVLKATEKYIKSRGMY